MHKYTINENGVENDYNLLIRTEEELSDNEIKLIKSAKLEGIAPVQAWTAIGTNFQLAYSTHGIFRYFGKFPPPIATYLISNYTDEGDFVFDLMSGSGTTGVEAVLLNRKSLINDVNPLSRLLGFVKTRRIEKNKIEKSLKYIEENYEPLSQSDYNYNPVGLKNPDHWFLPETKDSLRGIIKIINDIDDDDVKKFMLISFAGIVRRVSKATTQQGRLFLDVETAEKDALQLFIKKTKKNIEAISDFPKKSIVPIVTDYNVMEGLPSKYNNVADLIILHPPYFNSYKYSSVNSLELSWLQLDHADVRKEEVREFFKIGKPEKYHDYVSDMVKVIENSIKIVKRGKVIALMIGDTIMKGKHIQVTKEILERLDKNIIKVELIALRVPKYTEAAWVASQRRNKNDIGIYLNDYIIVLRRID